MELRLTEKARDASIPTGSCVSPTRIAFSTKGTGTFRRTKKGYLLSIQIDHVEDSRCLVFYGEHTLQRGPQKKPPAKPE